MFADKIMETITPAGTGAYQLAGPPAGSAYGTWRSKFPTATVVGYFASNAAGTKWEMGYGTLTYGSPDTLSRNLFAGTNSSSTGSLISWASGDSPVNVYSVPIGVMMAHLVSGGLLSTRPAWAQAGLGWLDYTIGLATTWVKKRWTGTVDIEEGRFDIAAGIFTPSPRNKWVDNGAVNLTMLATHVGQVILFDCSAAARTFTALAGATAGIGHGFTVWVEGYGSTVNGITLAPNGSEKIDQGAAGASLTIPPNRLTRLSWDGAKSQWRTDYTPAPAWAGVRQTVAAGPVDTAGLPTFLPATSGSFTLTGQNVSSSSPLVASAAAGWSVTGQPIDYVGATTSNPVWSSLAASRAAATPNFLYATIAAGVFTYGSTILAPIYQWGGTPATTSGQITFNIGEMKCYLGNGSTAPQVALVLFGEAATDGSGVISTVAYAYNGRYDSGWTATLPAASTAVSKNHNIGVVPRLCDFRVQCTTTDNGYAVGDEIGLGSISAYDGGTIRVPTLTVSAKALSIVSTASNPYNILVKSTGVASALTAANWKYKFAADRGW